MVWLILGNAIQVSVFSPQLPNCWRFIGGIGTKALLKVFGIVGTIDDALILHHSVLYFLSMFLFIKHEVFLIVCHMIPCKQR